ncbi:autotransporter domain-containing protein, partial [Ochrobactrum sp. MR31]|nr:autotransporter domain-containing protein [Ochrobactrum sp. MR31]
YATGSSHIYAEHGDGRIETQAWGLGGTLTWYGDSGFYFDGQLQATWYNSSLHSFTVGKGLAADKNGLGYSLSAEAGKQFTLDAY